MSVKVKAIQVYANGRRLLQVGDTEIRSEADAKHLVRKGLVEIVKAEKKEKQKEEKKAEAMTTAKSAPKK